MNQLEKEIDDLYELCGISSSLRYPTYTELNEGQLNNKLYSEQDAFKRNSAFSYSACGASSVGLDWLNKNGFKF